MKIPPLLVRNRQKIITIGQKRKNGGFGGPKVGEIGQNTKNPK